MKQPATIFCIFLLSIMVLLCSKKNRVSSKGNKINIKNKNVKIFNPSLVQEFFYAVKKDSMKVVKNFLLKEPDLVHASNSLGFTALMHAARYGTPQMVELLLKNDADINAQANMGATALLRTIEPYKIENAKMLLKYGADPNIREISQKWAPLPCAAYYGYLRLVVLLVENNADINIKGKYKQTALHWSIRAISRDDQYGIVKYLLEQGVDANCKDVNGKTALQLAAKRGLTDIAELIRKKQ